jgi:hypothetical protein
MEGEVRPMTKRISMLCLLMWLGSAAWAQEFSAEALLGKWEFVAYAERDAPEERRPVGVIFEFRPDGVMISMMPDGAVESAYSVDGNTMRYGGQGGEQTWTVRTFVPDESIVMENAGTLMYLERR